MVSLASTDVCAQDLSNRSVSHAFIPASAAEIPAPPAARTRTERIVAKANLTLGRGTPFIEFRSRYALSYGHTFVVFGRLNSRGEVGEIKPEMVAGLHPAGDDPAQWAVGHLVPVPAETGWSDGDLEEEYVSNRMRVLLTEEQYQQVVAHIRHKQASSPVWHAALYNCNLWSGEIAAFLGLRTGFHWLPPAQYIEKMKELNTQDKQNTWIVSRLSRFGGTSAGSDAAPK